MKAMKPKALARAVSLGLCMCAAVSAQAAVGPAGAINAGGALDNIGYGAGGNVFELKPMLFVQGLGNANDPSSVVTLNPLLQYSFSVAGAGSSLMTIDYRITNSSAVQSFNDLRFMLFTNPDGDSVNFLDTVKETWGAANTGDPVRREAREFTNPAATLLASYQVNGNLTEGTDACLLGAGCDATVGLQWNAATLGPHESFLVRIGLSDDGQHLSSRFIDVTAVDAANTTLTLSGVSSVSAVPVPLSGVLLGSGFAGVLASARRRRRVAASQCQAET
ncbi:MAG: hypothetical protein IT492_24440 [Gammaproteobacteria bacterium]|nr:hypothetical protein [Gammaproteobacteria bacterium]